MNRLKLLKDYLTMVKDEWIIHTITAVRAR